MKNPRAFDPDEIVPLMLRVPAALRERIKLVAELEGRSMNAQVLHLLEMAFPENPTPRQPPKTISPELAEDLMAVLRKHAPDGF